jgi:DNA-binding NarL/FixJ family response regulator
LNVPISIVVVEDQYFFRLALRTTLEAHPDLRIVAEAENASEALTLCKAHKPDVAVVDLRLPGLSGFDLIAQLHRDLPSTRVLVLSNYEGSEDVHRALSAGALAYLTKDASAEELVKGILSVHSNRRFLSKAVGALLAERLTGSELTDRELDVLRLLVKGASNKEIGAQLGIAENTVRIHMAHILDKLGVADRTQAAVIAIQRGLVHID